ncbi:hypothetical protein SS50377_22550 [Spironucleus salmonicida]|uniref:Uncharacterized protein n=1 Tax=Spironucleus salmonicida TaxID=348837 RepID=V6LCH7_9EUKA|nr:hypothetical protein SS50377_22550 [Spironucleus salmonicida]|eukprot:EST41958.1 Hypothetical protein SS50377_18263 [Spironucleus salmonicida]
MMNVQNLLQRYLNNAVFYTHLDQQNNFFTVCNDELFQFDSNKVKKQIENFQLLNDGSLYVVREGASELICSHCSDFTVSHKKHLLVFYSGALTLRDTRSPRQIFLDSPEIFSMFLSEETLFLASENSIFALDLNRTAAPKRVFQFSKNPVRPLSVQVIDQFCVVQTAPKSLLFRLDAKLSLTVYFPYRVELFGTYSGQVFLLNFRQGTAVELSQFQQFTIPRSLVYCSGFFALGSAIFRFD